MCLSHEDGRNCDRETTPDCRALAFRASSGLRAGAQQLLGSLHHAFRRLTRATRHQRPALHTKITTAARGSLYQNPGVRSTSTIALAAAGLPPLATTSRPRAAHRASTASTNCVAACACKSSPGHCGNSCEVDLVLPEVSRPVTPAIEPCPMVGRVTGTSATTARGCGSDCAVVD